MYVEKPTVRLGGKMADVVIAVTYFPKGTQGGASNVRAVLTYDNKRTTNQTEFTEMYDAFMAIPTAAVGPVPQIIRDVPTSAQAAVTLSAAGTPTAKLCGRSRFDTGVPGMPNHEIFVR
jgi:hypothetical protein